MKVLMINSVCGIRSTGRICTDLANILTNEGHEVKIAYGRENVPEKYEKFAVRIGNTTNIMKHVICTRLFDDHGFASRKATKEFLKWADIYDPDLLWIHNIHGYYINVRMLFEWIKKRPNMQVRWTLHDCWAFTGHCTYFTMARCDRWKDYCHDCPKKTAYPSSYLFDKSYKNFVIKKNLFTGVRNLTLITPSRWLCELVKESFLCEYPIQVVNNTINTSLFKPTPSNFKEKYGLEGKKIILGVASIWDERKGLTDFVRLSSMIDSSYSIVLVGVDEKQAKKLPKNITVIRRTDSAEQLAEIYTASDVFFNPTYEDNYPTVNLEAVACGTYVVTYKTGGSPESAGEGAGVVNVGDVDAAYKLIKKHCADI